MLGKRVYIVSKTYYSLVFLVSLCCMMIELRMFFFREVIDEYGKEVVKLCGRIMKILSLNLGLEEDFLQKGFGGEDIGACLRVNFYPKCPQPDLTLGLSSHSDPGGMTVLLPDQHVAGLQVLKDDTWITVKPAPHAFIVNIGDQIQVNFFSS